MKIHLSRPTKIWIGVFGFWAVLLSGVLNSVGGSPGILQSLRLNSLLQSRQTQLNSLEEEIAQMETEGHHLEKSRLAQEREIRRVLGYAGSDEIIFDFTATQQAAPIHK